MCNLYGMRAQRSEVVAAVRAMHDRNNNQPPMAGIWPDYSAPVVVDGDAGREMRDMRWGMPSSKKALFEAAQKRAAKLEAKGTEFDFADLLRMEPDKGTTNVRNTASAHWKAWLAPKHRCLVPFTSFSEPDQVGGTLKPVWFALAADEPLAFFAGIWTPHACVRKIKTGWEEVEAYGFLTTDSAEPVATYHSKAMPVVLTTADEWDLWLSDAPWSEVAALQRPLHNRLVIVPAPPKPEAAGTLL
jgi:putative SOS response-associated peptidase YedK